MSKEYNAVRLLAVATPRLSTRKYNKNGEIITRTKWKLSDKFKEEMELFMEQTIKELEEYRNKIKVK